MSDAPTDVPRAYLYVDLGIGLSDIPPADTRCSLCGGSVQRELLAYEDEIAGVHISARTVPGYGCTVCADKYWEPAVLVQLFEAVGDEARRRGHKRVAEYYGNEVCRLRDGQPARV
jgi:hypothetical protein